MVPECESWRAFTWNLKTPFFLVRHLSKYIILQPPVALSVRAPSSWKRASQHYFVSHFSFSCELSSVAFRKSREVPPTKLTQRSILIHQLTRESSHAQILMTEPWVSSSVRSTTLNKNSKLTKTDFEDFWQLLQLGPSECSCLMVLIPCLWYVDTKGTRITRSHHIFSQGHVVPHH